MSKWMEQVRDGVIHDYDEPRLPAPERMVNLPARSPVVRLPARQRGPVLPCGKTGLRVTDHPDPQTLG